MIILIDTSDKVCKTTLIDNDRRYSYDWESHMKLSKELLGYLDDIFKKHKKSWSDIKGIGVFEGPGSFTGLRIGLTVMNTLADAMKIPIVGGRGENWQDEAAKKLKAGQDEKIVLPFYDRGANITTPRK